MINSCVFFIIEKNTFKKLIFQSKISAYTLFFGNFTTKNPFKFNLKTTVSIAKMAKIPLFYWQNWTATGFEAATFWFWNDTSTTELLNMHFTYSVRCFFLVFVTGNFYKIFFRYDSKAQRIRHRTTSEHRCHCVIAPSVMKLSICLITKNLSVRGPTKFWKIISKNFSERWFNKENCHKNCK